MCWTDVRDSLQHTFTQLFPYEEINSYDRAMVEWTLAGLIIFPFTSAAVTPNISSFLIKDVALEAEFSSSIKPTYQRRIILSKAILNFRYWELLFLRNREDWIELKHYRGN